MPHIVEIGTICNRIGMGMSCDHFTKSAKPQSLVAMPIIPFRRNNDRSIPGIEHEQVSHTDRVSIGDVLVTNNENPMLVADGSPARVVGNMHHHRFTRIDLIVYYPQRPVRTLRPPIFPSAIAAPIVGVILHALHEHGVAISARITRTTTAMGGVARLLSNSRYLRGIIGKSL